MIIKLFSLKYPAYNEPSSYTSHYTSPKRHKQMCMYKTTPSFIQFIYPFSPGPILSPILVPDTKSRQTPFYLQEAQAIPKDRHVRRLPVKDPLEAKDQKVGTKSCLDIVLKGKCTYISIYCHLRIRKGLIRIFLN